MDPTLAEIYGTEETLEKSAADELANALLAEGASEAEVAQILAQESGEDPDAETLEKMSEADYLGRVMAHAYVNELGSLEKNAAEGKAARLAELLKGGKGASGVKDRILGVKGERLKSLGARGAVAAGTLGTAYGAYRGGKALHGKYKARKERKAAEAAMAKQSSEIDALVEQRALELLDEAGLLD